LRASVVITGGTGFLGRNLSQFLSQKGFRILILSYGGKRSSSSEEFYRWDPYTFSRTNIEKVASLLEGSTVLIHLSGKNIGSFSLSPFFFRELYKSRVETTRFLVECVKRCKKPPKIWLQGSAVGIYGSRGDTILTEESPPGEGPLSRLCKEWESPLKEISLPICKTFLRTGIVLSPTSLFWKRLTFPYRHTFEVQFSGENPWYSWISLKDYLEGVHFLIKNPVDGPVNLTAPEPFTWKDLSETLRKWYKPRFHLSLPSSFLRSILGEFRFSLLFGSTRAIPLLLLRKEFPFAHSTLSSMEKELFP